MAPKIVGIKPRAGFIEREKVITIQVQINAIKTHHHCPIMKPATSIARIPKVDMMLLKSKSNGKIPTSGLQPAREFTILDWSNDKPKNTTEII